MVRAWIYKALIGFSSGHWTCVYPPSVGTLEVLLDLTLTLTRTLFYLSEPASLSAVRVVGKHVCTCPARHGAGRGCLGQGVGAWDLGERMWA